jgi:ribonuclease VapC
MMKRDFRSDGVDTSALAAILFREDDAKEYRTHIEASHESSMSAASVIECAVLFPHRLGAPGSRWLDQRLVTGQIEVVAFDAEQLAVARAAYLRFGKGHHPAALNFGDCFSYAVAKIRGEALLFKGQDFSQTDIERVIV